MSDDGNEMQRARSNSTGQDINHRLSEIKSELHSLMRQKKKYDVEKIIQETDFLTGEVQEMQRELSELKKEITAQSQLRRTLHAQRNNFRSHSRLRFASLAVAMRDKRRYEEELKKTDKTNQYRQLARQQIAAIESELPALKEEADYLARIKNADDAQKVAGDRRQKLEDTLNRHLRKQSENKQLMSESAEKLPALETSIESLRDERAMLLKSSSLLAASGTRKQRRRSSNHTQESGETDVTPTATCAPLDSLEEDKLQSEQRRLEEQLTQVYLLIKYFREKMVEHNLLVDTPTSSLSPCSSDLTSPLYPPASPAGEQIARSAFATNERDKSISCLSAGHHEQAAPAVAMKLPRTFIPLNFDKTTITTNEIIHSPYVEGQQAIVYKKELEPDILDKYGGQKMRKNEGQHATASMPISKKGRKNKKGFGIKHSPQMIALYNNVRSSCPDTLPSMPMYEYDLGTTLKALETIRQSIDSYLFDLVRRRDLLPRMTRLDSDATGGGEEEQDEDEDDVRDSALDTFSETSSLVEPLHNVKLLPPPSRLLPDINEVKSSSSSDEKRTATVSSASPPSSHHSSDQAKKPANNDHRSPSSTSALLPSAAAKQELTTLNGTPLLQAPFMPPLSIQMAPIDRQISDEGYRSVRGGEAANNMVVTTTASSGVSLHDRSLKSYDSTEKVDKWLSSTATASYSAPPLELDDADDNDFQATTDDVSLLPSIESVDETS